MVFLRRLCLFFFVFSALSLVAAQATGHKSKAKHKSKGTYSKVVRKRSSKNHKITKNSAPPPEPIVQAEMLQKVAQVRRTQAGRIVLAGIPSFSLGQTAKAKGLSDNNESIFYTINSDLQNYADKLVAHTRAPHVAVVAMDPNSGRILALSGKSTLLKEPILHAGFPAASLFKVVTAAASVERGGMYPLKEIGFRGGLYTLNQGNFRPDSSKDTLSMTAAEALGRSCNPVFGRIGLLYSNPRIIREYAKAFGFNSVLSFEAPLPPSSAYIPENDYEFSKTCAGFGTVTLSPIHAATIMSAIANGGMLVSPSFVERIYSANNKLLYESKPSLIQRAMHPDTAAILLQMMEYTTTVGTSKREFARNKQNRLKNIRVAAKTGTLRGDNPHGLNHWFLAAAPIEHPKIALAIIVIDGGSLDSKPSHIGRLILEKYFLG